MINDSETADTTAPPKPCTARAQTSSTCEFAMPQASDATVKRVMPPRNSLRWPYRSPSLPPSSRKPPNVSI
jgi:hypothetical protein